jgi:hypothetical protein
MAREEIRHIDISNTPDLLRLAEEVHRSHTRVVLTNDNQDLAVVSPAQPSESQLGIASVDTDPTTWDDIERLEGVAGSLAQPLSLKEVRRIAYDERFETKQQSDE